MKETRTHIPVWLAVGLSALFLSSATGWAAQSRIFFSDLDSGPNSGGQGNAGAFVTIYGKRFGDTRATSFVTIGGGRAAAYASWSDTKITFQLGREAATGGIVVTTAAGASNSVPFTVRSGNIYFVATTGSDGNSGSFTSPWRTILKARDAIRPGDIAYAMDGVSQTADDGRGWSAALTMHSQSGGSAGAPKALVAYPGATVTIGSVAGTPSFGIRTTGPPSYWTFAGLVLRGLMAVHIDGPSSGWRLVGNDLSCPNNTTGSCLSTSKSSDFKFLGNNVHHVGTVNASALNHGVYIGTDSNHVDVGWNSIAYVRGCRGLQIHSTPLEAGTGKNQYDLSIHDNVIHDTQCDGLVLATVDPSQGKVEVYNNVIYNAGQGPNNADRTGSWSCINVSGYTNAGPAGGGTVEIFNNTLYNCGTFATPPYRDVRSGVMNGGANQELRVRLRNNIIQMPAGVPYVVIWGRSAVCPDSANCNGINGFNNLLFGSGSAPSNTNITRSVNSDPQFLNAAQADFHLAERSPARRAGIETSAGTDKDGLPRGGDAGYDLGAFQFTRPGIAAVLCTPPAICTPGTTTCDLMLDSGAPAGGLEVGIASDHPNVSVPFRVMVQEGSSTARITVNAAAVNARTPAAISAAAGDSKQAAEIWLMPNLSPAVLNVVNAASFQPGPVAPGGIVTAFGFNLGPQELVQARSGGDRFPTALAGVTAFFDDIPAVLLSVQSGQLNAIVPYGVAGKDRVRLEMDVQGERSNPLSLPVTATAPGLFTPDCTGKGQALVLNENGSFNSPASPARKGSAITVYAAGLGQMEPPGVDGLLAAEPLPKPTAPVSMSIDDIDAELLYAGAALGFVLGLYQISVRVPESAASGVAAPLVLRAGNAASQPGVTIAIE